MNIGDDATKHAYIELLIDTLEKKKKILVWLMNVTKQQEAIVATDPFDEQLFNETINIKESHLNELKQLDEGFETVYNHVRSEVSENKERYKADIRLMQILVTSITDLSIELQALERRNKSKMDFLFSQKRKGIRDSRISSKTVTSYYKTMARQPEEQSLFYDKKK